MAKRYKTSLFSRHKEIKPIFIILIVILLESCGNDAKSRSGGGKSAVKSALPGLGKLQSTKHVNGHSTDHVKDHIGVDTMVSTTLYALKRTLLSNYDPGMRPVRNVSDVLEVEVDVIYRQVLDMDEKNQLLTSLVWYRQHWQDTYLKWDPGEFEGLSELWLTAESVWRPDIVLQEETGTKDYSPRLPFVKVGSGGHVEYHEPTSFTTSCSMNTMHFPFDVQHCTLTFSSWTHPGSKISLNSERTNKQMINDLGIFVNTGEWKLEHIDVKKQASNYSNIMVESAADYIDWPEVVFTVTLRRNASFYMQSMMFPSILLTTIALLGFFLPPDSGERVGLQITILLTFMVFLLTVCEMFPASTGPYLGVYYVICIFLLAVNLFMTVFVLQLYYHPCKPVPIWIKSFMYKLGRCCFIDVSVLEEFTNLTNSDNNPDSSFRRSRKGRVAKSCLCNVMLSCLKEEEAEGDSASRKHIKSAECRFRSERQRVYPSSPTPPFRRARIFAMRRNNGQSEMCSRCTYHSSSSMSSVESASSRIDQSYNSPCSGRHKAVDSPSFNRSIILRKEYVPENGTRAGRRAFYYLPGNECNGSDVREDNNTANKKRTFRKCVESTIDANGTKVDKEKPVAKEEIAQEKGKSDENTIDEKLVHICDKVGDVLNEMKDVILNIKEKSNESDMEVEWKKLALMVDKLFLRVYLALLVISHTAIVALALMTSYTIEPHQQHLRGGDFLRPSADAEPIEHH